MTFSRAITFNKLVQIGTLKLVCFLREVHVCPQVIDPQRFCPRFLLGRLCIEEQHIGLHTPGVEDSGGQP